ncbi:gamma-glutamyltransferase [Oxalobacteraceae bacterium R-40]|uniref:Glutathione hydrolase proenzyme n=1 Tax=Keguizhuia sedimenti TaxID=3064264 RepID=A0ABU1BLS4_9BURK|nr:gamma-glutamyltransferase [Oxalobacteraceae bacterium R-40]
MNLSFFDRISVFVSGIAIAGSLFGCAATTQPPDLQESSLPHAPEAATGYAEKPGWLAKTFMIASANPLATDAGYRILKAGGTAVDAAIAAQMVLTLVEPQSSGIGGGAFLLHSDGRRIEAYDGRETAPAEADERLFYGDKDETVAFFDAIVGGRAVGVPGVLRMLELAHKKHGALPWPELFQPAIDLAENGFAVSPRLARLIAIDPHLKKDATAAGYLYDKSGQPLQPGQILKNPDLAHTLRQIAQGGADVFYLGAIAREIEKKVKGHLRNPGHLSVADLANYQAKVREPICSDYKQWQICGMPPPSSGGIAIAQMLGMLEEKTIQAFPPTDGQPDPQAVHLISEAGRLAYADRDRYVADPDFVSLPGKGMAALIDKDYLAERAKMIGEKSMGVAHPGMPFQQLPRMGADSLSERPATTHLSVVDRFGNMVAMTSTIEDAFGSRQMVAGFLLNNELSDFSFQAKDANGPIANRVQGGKRPRSSMSPTMVVDKTTGKAVLSLGSPGGSAIPNYVIKALFGMMDWQMNLQQAISLPNFGSRNGPTELETGRASETLIRQLKSKGHTVRIMDQTSGLQGIARMSVHGEHMWFGAADPRREGIAKGD